MWIWRIATYRFGRERRTNIRRLCPFMLRRVAVVVVPARTQNLYNTIRVCVCVLFRDRITVSYKNRYRINNVDHWRVWRVFSRGIFGTRDGMVSERVCLKRISVTVGQINVVGVYYVTYVSAANSPIRVAPHTFRVNRKAFMITVQSRPS